MKQFALIISIVAAFSLTSNAQFLSYGVKGGVNSSKIRFKAVELDNIQTADGIKDYILDQGDSKLGFHAGVFAKIQVFKLFIQPELLFTQTRGEFKVIDQTDTDNTQTNFAEQRINKIDLPVMVGWKFGPAKVFLGPVASLIISEKSELNKYITAAESQLENAVFGYQAGVGIDILEFATFDIKYEGNLSRFGESIKIGSNEPLKLDQLNPQFIFSLGIYF